MTETTCNLVGKTLVNKITRVLVYVDAAYIGASNNLLLSVLDDGRRHLIDCETELLNWEDFGLCQDVVTIS